MSNRKQRVVLNGHFLVMNLLHLVYLSSRVSFKTSAVIAGYLKKVVAIHNII